jgi:Putative adhesin
MRALLLAVLFGLTSGCIVIDEMDCRHRADRERVVTAPEALGQIEVLALAGSLEIRGREGATEIRVAGVACARRERDLEGIDIATRTAGDRVVIEAVIPEAARRRGARLDLTLDLPPGARLVVDDGSGDVVIENVAAVSLEDGSGDLQLDRVPGDVAIVDHSGDIALSGVGSVRVDDGSGDVTIRDAAAVTISDDGSGDLEIRDVSGDVVVLDDGSGDIEVSNVGGSLRIEDDGGGDVDYSGVAGPVDVPGKRREHSLPAEAPEC